MIKELFPDGIAAEPGHSAEPASYGGAGAAVGFQVAVEALDLRAAGAEHVHVMVVDQPAY